MEQNLSNPQKEDGNDEEATKIFILPKDMFKEYPEINKDNEEVF